MKSKNSHKYKARREFKALLRDITGHWVHCIVEYRSVSFCGDGCMEASWTNILGICGDPLIGGSMFRNTKHKACKQTLEKKKKPIRVNNPIFRKTNGGIFKVGSCNKKIVWKNRYHKKRVWQGIRDAPTTSLSDIEFKLSFWKLSSVSWRRTKDKHS